MKQKKRIKKKTIEDVLLYEKMDRRTLSNVPDRTGLRSNIDRRGRDDNNKEHNGKKPKVTEYIDDKKKGIRFQVSYQVLVTYKDEKKRRRKLKCEGIDISTSGILLKFKNKDDFEKIKNCSKIKLEFEITEGSMPEGYEMKVKNIGYIKRFQENKGAILCGVEFKKNLAEYAKKRKDRFMLFSSSVLLTFIVATIILMRAESIIYFKFNKWFYFYSIVAAGFLLSRYLFACFYRPVPINPDFTPGVTILIPCFNEEEWIQRTISSCVNQDYPIDSLEVIIIDDCSTDKSVEKINEFLAYLYEDDEHFATKDRVKCIVLEKNAGKRDALIAGAEVAKHDLVVFVDSDSFLDPFAIRNLVQPFQDEKMGGVAGRTDVANTYTNGLTRMQSVRYYIAFRVMKAAESYFDTVTCLSGPLSCYKRSIVMENKDNWLNQSFLGQKATFGDDRAMTNFVLRHHRTGYQDTAICSTIVPNSYKVFLKQQMRWKRSWLRESIIAGGFIWRKEPFAAISFYMGLIVPILAPVVVLYNLVYVPITHRIFPLTFLVGILMMSLLMSAAQLFLRKSSTWLFGMLFCIYYEAVLLWQMPIAWVTFWKSTWGTRMTPSDVKAAEKKAAKEAAKKQKEEEKQKKQEATKKKKEDKKAGKEAKRMGKTKANIMLLFLLAGLSSFLNGCAKPSDDSVYVLTKSEEEKEIEALLASLDEQTESAKVQGKARITDKEMTLVFEGVENPTIMEELAILLRQYKVPATFFIPAAITREEPVIPSKLVEKDMILGNYGLLGEKGAQDFETERLVREVYRSQGIMEEFSGKEPIVAKMNSSVYTEEMLRIYAACGVDYVVEPTKYINYRSFNNQYEAEGFARKTERGSIVCVKLGAELDENEFHIEDEEIHEKEPVKPEDVGEERNTETTEGEQLIQMMKWLLEGYKKEEYQFLTVDELAKKDVTKETVELDEETLALLDPANYPLPLTEEPLGIKESEAVEDSYFDDVVFVGDSISLKLYYYVLAKRQGNADFLGSAEFLTASSLSASNALWEVSEESVHPAYLGQKLPVEESIALTGKKKAYILLGINDISNYDPDTCIENYRLLIDLILKKSPGCEIYIQSVTPKIKSVQDGVTNQEIFEYNLKLYRMCLEDGYHFIDVAHVLRDENGYLPDAYCSDPDTMGMHFKDEACAAWIQYLRTHTK